MLKITPKLKPTKLEDANLNDLDGGAIFLYQGNLYIKHEEACGGTNLLTGEYPAGLDNAVVEEVDAILNWQKKPKKKKKK